MGLQFLDQRIATFDFVAQDHEGFDDLRSQWIRYPDYGGKGHPPMAQQAILDFPWPDAVAAAGNDVIVAADKSNVAFRISLAYITSQEPVIHEFCRGRGVVVPVAQEHDRIRPLHGDVAGDTWGHHLSRRIDDCNPVTR